MLHLGSTMGTFAMLRDEWITYARINDHLISGVQTKAFLALILFELPDTAFVRVPLTTLATTPGCYGSKAP